MLPGAYVFVVLRRRTSDAEKLVARYFAPAHTHIHTDKCEWLTEIHRSLNYTHTHTHTHLHAPPPAAADSSEARAVVSRVSVVVSVDDVAIFFSMILTSAVSQRKQAIGRESNRTNEVLIAMLAGTH